MTKMSSRSYAYLAALTQEIEKKLQRAFASASQRRNLLQELFADIALKVDDRARDIIFTEEDQNSLVEDSTEGTLCFYSVLADYFVAVPQNGKPILDLIVQLWSQSFASNIFALLFHKWLFEAQLDSPEVLLRYSSALVQGATNVFWIDIQSNTRLFQCLFRYLLEEVALAPVQLKKIPLQAQRDVFLLLSRFMIFYNATEKLESFLKQFPEYPNTFLVDGPGDIFVIEIADQLQKLKVEPVLLHYLSHIKILQGIELRMTTSTRLKTCLYSFTSPGGPMYPTRVVRHAAWEALDALFPMKGSQMVWGRNPRCLCSLENIQPSLQRLINPMDQLVPWTVGRYPRHIISFFFRLLYPWYWPSSCWNFVVACLYAVFYPAVRLIFSFWGRGRRVNQD